MIKWRNRSIDALSAPELRLALADAMDEIAWSRRAPSSVSFFNALLLGFSAGAIVAATAAFTILTLS
jgi:hypothetical protein